jgi:hypothetical protein
MGCATTPAASPTDSTLTRRRGTATPTKPPPNRGGQRGMEPAHIADRYLRWAKPHETTRVIQPYGLVLKAGRCPEPFGRVDRSVKGMSRNPVFVC